MPLVFEGQRLRITPDGQFAAVDVLKAIGQKDERNAWKNLKKQYPELVEESSTYSFGTGRPPEVLSEKGLLKLLMVAKGPKSARFREWAATQLQRQIRGDITLAAEIADRSTSAPDLEWLGARALSKSTVIDLNRSISAAGCNQTIYSKAHDANNVAVTGMTAAEIQRERGVKATRDGLDVVELGLMIALQGTQARQIRNQQARGEGQVLTIIYSAAHKIAALRRELVGPINYPRHGFLQTTI